MVDWRGRPTPSRAGECGEGGEIGGGVGGGGGWSSNDDDVDDDADGDNGMISLFPPREQMG
jgi:hypothetical protein